MRTGAKVATVGASLAAVVTLAVPTVAHWEGKRNEPYRDVTALLTVCYGETRGVQNRRYSDAECNAMLRASLAEHAAGVRRCIPASTPLQTQAALASFAYNVGVRAACGSTAVRKITAGDIRGGCDALMAWNKARIGGKLQVVRGLTNRRADERRLCLEGLS